MGKYTTETCKHTLDSTPDVLAVSQCDLHQKHVNQYYT